MMLRTGGRKISLGNSIFARTTRIFWQACSSTISFFTVGMQVAMVDPSSVRSFRMDDNS